MSDLERLRSRISRLADAPSPVDGRTRMLSEAGLFDPVVAMQREIEETQLPRSLVFINDRGDLLTLHVKAGRIASVADLSHCGGSERDIVGLALSGADASQKERLFQVINGFLQGATGLSVNSSMQAPDISPAVMGICPLDCFSALTRIEQVTGPVRTSADPGVFLNRCADIASAWIWVHGTEIYQRYGDPSRISKLHELARNELEERATRPTNMATTTSEDRCVVICSAGPNADAILSGCLGGELVFVAFPASDAAVILGFWSGAVAQSVDFHADVTYAPSPSH